MGRTHAQERMDTELLTLSIAGGVTVVFWALVLSLGAYVRPRSGRRGCEISTCDPRQRSFLPSSGLLFLSPSAFPPLPLSRSGFPVDYFCGPGGGPPLCHGLHDYRV